MRTIMETAAARTKQTAVEALGVQPIQADLYIIKTGMIVQPDRKRSPAVRCMAKSACSGHSA